MEKNFPGIYPGNRSKSKEVEMEEDKQVTGKEDWWKQDKVDAVGWGFVFILGALILLAEVSGFGANPVLASSPWWGLLFVCRYQVTGVNGQVD